MVIIQELEPPCDILCPWCHSERVHQMGAFVVNHIAHPEEPSIVIAFDRIDCSEGDVRTDGDSADQGVQLVYGCGDCDQTFGVAIELSDDRTRLTVVHDTDRAKTE